MSIFVGISFFLELALLTKIDLDEGERYCMSFLIGCSGLTTLVGVICLIVWGENIFSQLLIPWAVSEVSAIWMIIILSGYNYLVRKIKWKRDLKKEKDISAFKHI